jgi:hypothetical protein
MLEFYLRSARGIARARSSLVGSYLDIMRSQRRASPQNTASAIADCA